MDGKTVEESRSEKLLGVVVNNNLTWREHIHGDESNIGLTKQLSQRVGMLKQLSKKVDKKDLKVYADGIFYSRLNNCLPVFGNVFGLDGLKESATRYSSYTMADNHELQVIQNKLNRMLSGCEVYVKSPILCQYNS